MAFSDQRIGRRSAIKTSLGIAVASLCPGTVPRAPGFESANERPTIGVIGCGVRWDKRVFVPDGRYGVGKEFPKFGDIVSVTRARSSFCASGIRRAEKNSTRLVSVHRRCQSIR